MKDYKRLTIKNEENGLWGIDGKLVNQYQKPLNVFEEAFYIAVTRLAELEDKIENGTLIELPCKVGTTVYYIGSLEVRAFFKIKTIYDIVAMPFSLDMLGGYKNVWFLTKAEAEQRLKELQNNE